MKRKKFFLLCMFLSAAALAAGACSPPENGDGEKDPPVVQTDPATYSVKLGGTHFLLAGEEGGSVTLSPVVKADKVTLENAVCTYSVSDPAIAEVDEEGVVRAKGYGTAEITATYTAPSGKSASDKTTVKVFEEATAEEVNSFDEQFVNIYGRTDPPEGALNIDNIGAGIEVAFYGTELKADLTVTQPANGMKLYGRVFIDGEMQEEFSPFYSGKGLVLAEGLEEGIHTVAVHKSCEIDEGRLAVDRFYADRFLRIPEKSDLKIEFIGDSITCGYGNLVKGGTGINRNSENSDACLGYAFLTGQALGADFSLVSYSGICVKQFMWGSQLNMEELHTYTSLQTKKPHSYDADMDAVVLNLGTNDASYLNEHPRYAKQFPEDYKEFLTHLREVYPDAYIVCIYGMMGVNNHIEDGIEQAIGEMADEKISYKKFVYNTSGVNGHPLYTAHAAYAKQLTEYIRGLLG